MSPRPQKVTDDEIFMAASFGDLCGGDAGGGAGVEIDAVRKELCDGICLAFGRGFEEPFGE